MGQHLPRSWLRHNRASPAGITIPVFWNKTEAVAISAPAASQKLLELAFLLHFKLFKLNVTLFSKRFGCQQLKAQSCFGQGLPRWIFTDTEMSSAWFSTHTKSGIRKAAPRIHMESLTLCNFYSCPLSAWGHFTLSLCQWR